MKPKRMGWRARLALALCALTLATAAPAQQAPATPAVLATTEAPAPAPAPASALPGGYAWEIMFSPYAVHYHDDSQHKAVWLIGIEGHRPQNWFWGFGLFSNSFGQPSVYTIYGYQWDDLFGVPNVYAKLAAGVMFGYTEPYQNKVPYNRGGFSPLVLPAVGYRLTKQDALQLTVLGTAGLMFSYNRRF
jgi:hypothetical protein